MMWRPSPWEGADERLGSGQPSFIHQLHSSPSNPLRPAISASVHLIRVQVSILLASRTSDVAIDRLEWARLDGWLNIPWSSHSKNHKRLVGKTCSQPSNRLRVLEPSWAEWNYECSIGTVTGLGSRFRYLSAIDSSVPVLIPTNQSPETWCISAHYSSYLPTDDGNNPTIRLPTDDGNKLIHY